MPFSSRDARTVLVCLSLTVTCALAAIGAADTNSTTGKTTTLHPSSTPANKSVTTSTPLLTHQVTTGITTEVNTSTLITTVVTSAPETEAGKVSSKRSSVEVQSTAKVTNSPSTNPKLSSVQVTGGTSEKTNTVIETTNTLTTSPSITPSPTVVPTTALPSQTVDYCTNDTQCLNEGNCISGADNYTCNCTLGWTGRNCEKEEYCQNATCSNEATCHSGADNYTCTCTPGWMGWHCTDDVDDCGSLPCKNGGNCTDTGTNRFDCSCSERWVGKTCETDVDNQCESNPCGPYGYCQNSEGNYTCYCNDGSVQVTPCRQPDFCISNPCSKDVNEICVTNNVTYTCECKRGYHYRSRDGQCEEILLFNYGVKRGEDEMNGPYFAGGGLPYFGQMYTAFYVNSNGYIVLDRYRNLKNPILNGSEWPTDVKLIAPFWSHWDVPSGRAYLYISDYYRYQPDNNGTLSEIKELIRNKTNQSDFIPEFALVVTWMDVIPYPASNYSGFRHATFQCTIVTDGARSYAVFAYDDIQLENFSGIAESSGYSTTNSAVILRKITTGMKKRTVYKLFEDTETSKPNDNYKCLDMLAEVPAPSTYRINNTCPCSISQARLDMRFVFDESKGCARERLGEQPAKCCFDPNFGTLLTNVQSAGFAQNRDGNTSQSINAAHDVCCGKNSTLCGVFYNKFPSDTCAKYQKLTMVQYWGNPVSHLDGTTYIFNGLGEYVLAGDTKQSATWLKGLLEQREATPNITILTAVMIEVNYEGVEAKLNMTTNQVDFYYEGKPIQNGDTTDYYSLTNNTVLFSNGIYIEAIQDNELLVTMYVPEPEKEFLKTGLLTELNKGLVNQTLVDATRIQEPTDNSTDLTDFPLYYSNFSDYRDVLFRSDSDAVIHANQTCGDDIACLISNSDLTATGQILHERMEREKNLKILNMLPPAFSSVDNVWYVSGTDDQFSKIIKGPANKTVQSIITSAKYSFNDTTGLFIWNVTSAVPSSDKLFEFIIKDRNGENATFSPVIVMCECANTSQCDYNIFNYIQHRSMALYFHAVCRCPDSKRGDLCQTDTNVCDECFPGGTCNESRADNPCTCPNGLEGDGVKCYDKNECAGGVCGEHANCMNHIGYHNCSCLKGYEMKENKCVDINECKSKRNPCPGFVDELRQFCENTDGTCHVSCRPTFRGDNCTKKVDYIYSGNLVFAEVPGKKQTWTDELLYKDTAAFKTLAGRVEKVLKEVLSQKLSPQTIIVTVTGFTFIGSRQKRATDNAGEDTNEIQAAYEVATDKQATSTELMEALDSGLNVCDPQNVSCEFGSGTDAFVGVSRKQTYLNTDLDLCKSELTNNCHTASTTCVSSNGTFSCKCSQGFKEWSLQDNVCEDIDECHNQTATCGERSPQCTNLPGSYTCHCQTGYTWTDATNKCQLTDHCQSGPCENGASCVNTPGEQPGFACKCSYGWAGATCSDKDTEAERRRIIIIAVSASLGGLCFILLVALCCVFTRRKSSSKYRKHDDYALDNAVGDSVSRIPRPQVRRSTDNLEMVENLGSKTNLYMPLEEENALKERQESFSNKHTKFEQHPNTGESYTNPAYNGSGATSQYDHL